MSKELVERLRAWARVGSGSKEHSQDCEIAADLIERQSNTLSGMLKAYDAGLRVPDAEHIREARSLSKGES